MAERTEQQPRRGSSHAWPRSAVRHCFNLAHGHIEDARRFRDRRDHKYAEMSLADAAHAHGLARQLIRSIRS
jgi:hypothetical protein